jgi:hypothetical protein
MRPNTWGSLCWIAAVLLLSGCYRPWMYQQPGYGGAYSGGYTGTQSLPPGQYYGGNPTYIQGTPNGLQPEADPNNSGTGGGNGTGDGTGGNAPPYNPGTENPTRPVPMYDGNIPGADSGGQFEPPASEGTINENKIDLDGASNSEPDPAGEWSAEPVLETAEQTAETAEPAIEPVNSEELESASEVPPLFPTP